MCSNYTNKRTISKTYVYKAGLSKKCPLTTLAASVNLLYKVLCGELERKLKYGCSLQVFSRNGVVKQIKCQIVVFIKSRLIP